MRFAPWGAGLVLLCCLLLGCKRTEEVDCRKLGAAVGDRLAAIEEKHGSCKTDEDCVVAAVTLACDPQTPRTVALAKSRSAAFGKDVDAVAQELCGTPQKICNEFCKGKGSGFTIPALPRCRLGDCDADTVPGAGIRHFSSADLCQPKAHALID